MKGKEKERKGEKGKGENVKLEKNSVFLKKGKMVILVQNRKIL